MAATILAMPFHPAPPLTVRDADRATLQAIVRAPTSEQRAVTRARIILRSADAIPMERIAAEIGVAIMTVKLWRRRYAQAGLAGLADERRPGRPPTYSRAEREPQAAQDRDVQVQHRSGARSQDPRRCRALSRPARAGDRPLGR